MVLRFDYHATDDRNNPKTVNKTVNRTVNRNVNTNKRTAFQFRISFPLKLQDYTKRHVHACIYTYRRCSTFEWTAPVGLLGLQKMSMRVLSVKAALSFSGVNKNSS